MEKLLNPTFFNQTDQSLSEKMASLLVISWEISHLQCSFAAHYQFGYLNTLLFNIISSNNTKFNSFVSAPPIFIKRPHPVQTLKGSDIRLECELQGTPPFQISWYKDKREIRSSKKYKVMSENYLASIHILSVDTADVGEYHCKAVNDVGSDSCVGSVTLRGLYKDCRLLGISFFQLISSYISSPGVFFTVKYLLLNSTTNLCEEAE